MADTIGKAYVQVLPSTKGFGTSLTGEVDSAAKTAGDKGGESAGVNFAKKMLKGLAAAGFAKKLGDVVKGALDAGGAMEQAVGGISALFGDQAGYMVANAKKAWQTVGISANDYMEQVTGFSAALLSGLGGDTKKAAEVANQAMIDMGDNVNRFGTDMESVQNAIMGLSRGNFTMLDNLKLGFAGTQQGMIDLINASGIFEDKIDSLDGVTFDQMLSAIHNVQENLNITGTTASEAADTLQGSQAAMTAAWENLKAAMSTGTGLNEALSNMGESLKTYLENLFPMLGNALKALPNVFTSVFTSLAEDFDLQAVTDAIIAKIEMLPDLIGKFAEWLQETADGEGESKFGAAVGAILTALGKALIASLPALGSALDAGFQILVEMLAGLFGSLLTSFDGWINEDVLPRGREFVNKLGEGIKQVWETIKTTAGGIVTRVKQGIMDKFSEIVNAGRNLVTRFKTGIRNAISGLANVGMDIVRGIWRGISNGLGWIKDMISGWIGNVKDFIKSLFGINSPSKWAADVIGSMIPAGIAVGIEDNTGVIDSAMSDLRTAAYTGFNLPALNQSVNYMPSESTPLNPISFTIYGADHQDEMAIARYVERVLVGDIQRKELAYA